MRVFIAIDLPTEIKEKLAKLQKELKETHSFRGKFVEKENLHLALKFIGEVSKGDTAKISKELENICKEHTSFTLSLKGLGAFPSEDYVSVLWTGVEQGKDNLDALHADICKALGKKEKRKFVGHVTLARVKSTSDKAKLKGKFKKHKETSFGSFEVKEIKLIKSELTRGGPVYKVIKEFELLG